MSDPVETIMTITACTKEQATEALSKFNTVEDACDYLLFVGPVTEPKKRKIELTPEQKEIAKVRKLMEEMDAKHNARSTSANQPASLE